MTDTSYEQLSPRTTRALLSALDEVSGEDRIGGLIAALEMRIEAQLGALLMHPAVRDRERPWTALWSVIERMQPGSRIRVEMLDIRKQDLLLDFEDSPEPEKSGLFSHLYSKLYWGAFPGYPYGLVVGLYPFGGGEMDMELLEPIAWVCREASVPFLADASPLLIESEPTKRLKALQEREEGRFVHLSHSCFIEAYVARLATIFAESRWGALFTEEADENSHRGLTGEPLSELLALTRFAQVLRTLHRERLGSHRALQEREEVLVGWLTRFVHEGEPGSGPSFTEQPLRSAELSLSEIEGQPGRIRCALSIRPRGSDRELRLTIRLRRD